jgi:hypothetical protein
MVPRCSSRHPTAAKASARLLQAVISGRRTGKCQHALALNVLECAGTHMRAHDV